MTVDNEEASESVEARLKTTPVVSFIPPPRGERRGDAKVSRRGETLGDPNPKAGLLPLLLLLLPPPLPNNVGLRSELLSLRCGEGDRLNLLSLLELVDTLLLFRRKSNAALFRRLSTIDVSSVDFSPLKTEARLATEDGLRSDNFEIELERRSPPNKPKPPPPPPWELALDNFRSE